MTDDDRVIEFVHQPDTPFIMGRNIVDGDVVYEAGDGRMCLFSDDVTSLTGWEDAAQRLADKTGEPAEKVRKWLTR